MVFKHRVKRNGIYYETGQDVPMGNEEKKTPEPEQTIAEISDDNTVFEEANTAKRGRPKKTD